jgi:2-hydroxychromene-2-carboxylate isomerase
MRGRKKFVAQDGLTVDTWIKNAMSKGSRLASKVIEEGNALGFSERVIRDAKSRLGVVSRHQPGDKRFWWRDMTVPDLPANSGNGVTHQEFQELKRMVTVLVGTVKRMAKDSGIPITIITKDYLIETARAEWRYLPLDATAEDREAYLQEVIEYLKAQVNENLCEVAIKDQDIVTFAVMAGLDEDRARESRQHETVKSGPEAEPNSDSLLSV